MIKGMRVPIIWLVDCAFFYSSLVYLSHVLVIYGEGRVPLFWGASNVVYFLEELGSVEDL
jgi:hypothetical protein